jgi:hypothetical protein
MGEVAARAWIYDPVPERNLSNPNRIDGWMAEAWLRWNHDEHIDRVFGHGLTEAEARRDAEHKLEQKGVGYEFAQSADDF